MVCIVHFPLSSQRSVQMLHYVMSPYTRFYMTCILPLGRNFIVTVHILCKLQNYIDHLEAVCGWFHPIWDSSDVLYIT